jgi:hypothetical protein
MKLKRSLTLCKKPYLFIYLNPRAAAHGGGSKVKKMVFTLYRYHSL